MASSILKLKSFAYLITGKLWSNSANTKSCIGLLQRSQIRFCASNNSSKQSGVVLLNILALVETSFINPPTRIESGVVSATPFSVGSCKDIITQTDARFKKYLQLFLVTE